MTKEERNYIKRVLNDVIQTRSYVTTEMIIKSAWRKMNDGWFTYFYNTITGERKFKLEDGDLYDSN